MLKSKKIIAHFPWKIKFLPVISLAQSPEQQSAQPSITAEQLQEMKRMALENAIRQQQAMQQQQAPVFNREPEVVYVRRNLTICRTSSCYCIILRYCHRHSSSLELHNRPFATY